MAYYLSRRTFLRSIGAVAFGAMMTRALHANKSERQSPNFVVILTDDQSWVGSSVLMDPGDGSGLFYLRLLILPDIKKPCRIHSTAAV